MQGDDVKELLTIICHSSRKPGFRGDVPQGSPKVVSGTGDDACVGLAGTSNVFSGTSIMASAVHTSSRAGLTGKSAAGTRGSRQLIGGAAVLGVVVAALAWAIATFATVQGMTHSSSGTARFETSLGLKAIDRSAPQMRSVHLAKFSRLPGLKLELDAIALATPVKAVVATAGAKLEVAALTQALTRSMVAAASARNLTTGSIPATIDGKPASMVTALLETTRIEPGGLTKPFNLVISDEDQAMHRGLPGEGPMPLKRPGDLPKSLAAKELENDTGSNPRAKVKELAYAKPDIKVFEDDEDYVKPNFRGRKGTAYYDISAGVVYMPNGERLEAHSGIGKMRDNPDFAHIKMKGPTPPGTYKVTMRESLFHGVEAVRLTPTNGVAPHGRVGLLAHSYLLRNRGDSHGCVAFANYPKFLKAFKRGDITHMVIVDSMKGGFSTPKKTLASLFSRNS